MKLNLGCGTQAEPGYVNVDMVDLPGVDVVWELDTFPWPWEDGVFDEVKAFDVYEHVDHPLEFMGELHRVLQPGGLAWIHTSYWKGQNSFTDPTHKRFLTEGSFDYWIPTTPFGTRYGPAYARGRHFEHERPPEVMGDEIQFVLRKL